MTINTISPDEKDQVKINGVIRRLIEESDTFATTTEVAAAIAAAIAGSGVGVAGGRLTLQTLTPVMTTTQSAKTTIYYTPYNGSSVPIYSGTNFTATAFTELSAATSDTTKSPAAIGASKVNDWFVWLDGSTVTLSHGPDWTSDTARSAGTALVMVNGVLLNNASITNGPAASRGTYVGTTRSNASSQLDWILGGIAAGGTTGVFNVWNAYNRVNVTTFVGDNTDSWTYAVANTWRSVRAQDTMRVNFVTGLAEDGVEATHYGLGLTLTGGSSALTGVGYDATNALSGTSGPNATTTFAPMIATFSTTALGAHFMQAIERVLVDGTFYGDAGTPAVFQSGLAFSGRM